MNNDPHKKAKTVVKERQQNMRTPQSLTAVWQQ